MADHVELIDTVLMRWRSMRTSDVPKCRADILAALAAARLVIVSKEPTEAMIDAGINAKPTGVVMPIEDGVPVIYRAMIAAAGGDDG